MSPRICTSGLTCTEIAGRGRAYGPPKLSRKTLVYEGMVGVSGGFTRGDGHSVSLETKPTRLEEESR